MSRKLKEFKALFQQINQRLYSTDPEDQKAVAAKGFNEVVESLIAEFQGQINHGQFDPISNMCAAFDDLKFDQSACDGAWQALGIALAVPGDRESQWQEQTNQIVQMAPRAVLALVTRAYSNALRRNEREGAVLQRKPTAIDAHIDINAAAADRSVQPVLQGGITWHRISEDQYMALSSTAANPLQDGAGFGKLNISMSKPSKLEYEDKSSEWFDDHEHLSIVYIAGAMMMLSTDKNEIALKYRGYRADGFASKDEARLAAPAFAGQVFDLLKQRVIDYPPVMAPPKRDHSQGFEP
jgi:hypothetical protein